MSVPYEVLKELSGANDRQIQWWVRDGFIPGQPRTVGSGNWRTWTRTDLLHVRVLRLLREAQVIDESISFIMGLVVSEPWSVPLVVEIADNVTLTIDLPAIDALIPLFEEHR